MNTFGVDIGFDLIDDFSSSIGYYYQQGDLEEVDGSRIKGRLAY